LEEKALFFLLKNFVKITLRDSTANFYLIQLFMIIFLYGQDTFRSRLKLKELKDKFVREIDRSSLNIETLDGSKLVVADFEKAINTFPFLAKKRLVIVEDLLSKNRGQKIPNEILEILEKNDPAQVIIIFWESLSFAGKEKRSKSKSAKTGGALFAFLAKEKFAQEFGLLEQSGIGAWAKDQISKRGGKIKPAALNLLADMVGNDLWQLNSEIEKLLAYARGREIEAADVQLLLQSKLEEDIFKLTDALGAKNKTLALKLISDQLRAGTSPLELLSKMTWQFKNLLLVKSFMEINGAGYNPARLQYQLGLHPFVVKKTAAQVKNYSLSALKKTYQSLLQIDYRLKTSQASPEVLFDLLIAKS